VSPRPGSLGEFQQLEHDLASRRRGPGTEWRQHVRGLSVLVTVLVVAGVVVGLVPARGALHVYLLVVVAVGAVVAVTRVLSQFGRLERRPRWRRSGPASDVSVPAFFKRAQRQVELASTSIAQFEQLRPSLREIAEQRLARRGLRLRNDAARGLLGNEAWLLLDRPRQGDKFAPGPKPSELRALIEALERI
jgi:hypothetical protein